MITCLSNVDSYFFRHLCSYVTGKHNHTSNMRMEVVAKTQFHHSSVSGHGQSDQKFFRYSVCHFCAIWLHDKSTTEAGTYTNAFKQWCDCSILVTGVFTVSNVVSTVLIILTLTQYLEHNYYVPSTASLCKVQTSRTQQVMSFVLYILDTGYGLCLHLE